MKKTILLATNPFNFRPGINIMIAVLGGIIFIFGGIRYLIHNSSFEIFLGIGWLVIGIWYLAHGFIMSNPSSKFAPRFSLTEDEIIYRASVSKSPIKFDWNRIKNIEFGPYYLVIKSLDSSHTLHYSTNADTSKQIKSAIREIATSKNIEITGG